MPSIMTAAWADYRIRRLGVWAKGDENGRSFIRSIFAAALRAVWSKAKKDADRAARFAEQRRIEEAAEAVRMAAAMALTNDERAHRLHVIAFELAGNYLGRELRLDLRCEANLLHRAQVAVNLAGIDAALAAPLEIQAA